MKFLIAIVFLLTTSVGLCQNTTESELIEHRKEINTTFSNPETSILDSADVADFHGLEFFDYSEKFMVTAKFKKIKKGEVVGFATSTERIAKYRAYGILSFKINGKKCKLTVYEAAHPKNGYEDHLFLPFKDFTNGNSTYGGGRYLDLSKKDIQKKMILDFNYCYNPYCAYSDGYSCPVPPETNHLQVKIEAGVKSFSGH